MKREIRIGTILQHEFKDCGAVCLQVILKYYHLRQSLYKIRKKTYCSINGINLLDLKNACESYSLKSTCYELTLDALIREFEEPCILHWRQNHFVVLYAIRKTKSSCFFYLMDPCVGKVKVNVDTFKKAWLCSSKDGKSKAETGIVLMLIPNKAFEKNNVKNDKDRINVTFFFKQFKAYKIYLYVVLLCVLFANLIQFLFPFITQKIVDVGIKNKQINIVIFLLLSQAIFVISNNIYDLIRRRLILEINSRINIKIVSDFLYKLVNLPIRFFESRIVGDILQRINDHNKIEVFLTSTITDLVFCISTLLLFSVVLIIYSAKIFVFFILGTFLYLLWIYLFYEKRKQLDYSKFIQMAQNSNNLIEFIEGMIDIKLYNSQNKKRWAWEQTQIKLLKLNIESLTVEQYQNVGGIFINQIKNLILIYLCATMVINNSITIGTMLSIQFILGQLESPIGQVIGFVHDWQNAKIALERISELHIGDNSESAKLKVQQDKIHDITLQNVSFRYGSPATPLVLKNISFCIPAGKITAIVGASGSGKSTLFKLLLGFYKPILGEIKIDNIDLHRVNIRNWRGQCSVIMQGSYIFNDTIENNINLTEEDTDYNKLEDVVRFANLYDVIYSLPKKYQTIIGKEGHGLSGGQLQRLLIARALYKESNYIFLDEFTNSLDAHNEMEIIEKLQKRKKKKTIVIIAHRFSTIKNADQIIAISDGTIKEIGKHEELMNKRGIYYKLMKDQIILE